MNIEKNIPLFLVRVSLGVLFFYAGITKVLDPSWSAAGYIGSAKSFVWFYQALLHPSMLPIVNFLNAWGLTLLGLSLLLGLFVRLSSWLGAALMLLYYFVILDFPYPNAHAFLVDEHIVYAFVLILLGQMHAGRVLGLEVWCSNLPICSKYPRLREWLG